MRIYQRPFTLLETLIACALAVIVLSTLLFFYRQVVHVNTRVEELQKISFTERYVEYRLSSVFPRVFPADDSEKDFYFFTYRDHGNLFLPGSQTALVFSFDNGAHFEKPLSTHVIAQLYLDEKKRLCLAIWPSPKRWKEGSTPLMRKEGLMDQIDRFSMSFFIPPDKTIESKQSKKKDNPQQPQSQSQTTTTVKPSPEGSWIQEWSSDYKLLPGLVRLEMVRKGETYKYVFPLPHTARQIIY